MIGQTISHYKILEKLGEGGMGVVYHAEDTKLKRSVALKFLPPALLVNEDDRRRFVHEAQASAALSHPNIATVFEIDESGAQTFIALEYIEGSSLAEKIKSGPMKLDDAISITIQACEGLQAAHEKGIVHRDIKSQNIMVTTKNQVKILDFGLAKLRGASVVTKTGTTVGTMGYMSPEQLRGEAVDHRTDLWAVGVVLYEMIGGRRPFQGDYDEVVSYQIINQQPEPLTAIRTGVPMELERIVNKLLTKNASGRYQSTTDLLVDLRALKQTSDLLVPDAPASQGFKRRKGLLIGTAAIILFAASGILYYLLAPKSSGQIRSLAVLPLESLSREKNQEWFVDGMTEALTAEMSKIPSLSVRSRTSTAQYKGTTKSLPDIARELHADAVIEGSALQIGDRVRITVQLIDANDKHLWAKEYDGSMADVLTLHRDISQAIAREINAALSPSDQARIAQPSRVVPAAFEADLRGRQASLSATTAEGLQTAIEFFQRAIAIDTMYASAYADLAQTYWYLKDFGEKTPAESWQLAEGPNNKALQINPQLPLAHLNLFYYKYVIAWDWNGAFEELEKVRELAPNDADLLYALTDYYVFSGQFAKALETSSLLKEREPGTAGPWNNRAYAQYHSGDFDSSLRTLDEALKIFPTNSQLHNIRAWNLTMKQRHPEAVEEVRKAMSLTGDDPNVHAMGGWVIARAGLRSEALKEIETLKTMGRRWTEPLWLAVPYIGLGDYDRALDYIEEACRVHSPWAVFIKRAPPFYVLRGNPRYEKLILQMKLP